MLNFLLDIVQVNEKVDYALLASVIIAYLFILWFVVSIWVFGDSKKRYSSLITPALFTLFVIFFGPPALIFYILIRPEHTREENYYMNMALSGMRELKPIKFDGDQGFDISINLSVRPKETDEKSHQMIADFEWSPTPSMKKISEISVKQNVGVQNTKGEPRKSFNIKGISNLGNRLYLKVKDFGSRFIIQEEGNVKKSSIPVEEREKVYNDLDTNHIQKEIERKKAKKKKKKRKKRKKFKRNN